MRLVHPLVASVFAFGLFGLELGCPRQAPRPEHSAAIAASNSARPTASQQVTFRVVNKRAHPLFGLRDALLEESLILEHQEGSSWQSQYWRQPICMEECSASFTCANNHVGCHGEPGIPVAISPGETRSMTWQTLVYKLQSFNNKLDEQGRKPDGCSCFQQVGAPIGHYRAKICLVSELTCWNPAASASASASCLQGNVPIGGAQGTGPLVCADKEFDLADKDTVVDMEFH